MPRMHQHLQWSRSLLRILLPLAALACGGGGGGGGLEDGPALNVHFAADQLTARFFHDQAYLTNTYTQPLGVAVTGTVDPVPQGNIYVRVALDSPVFAPDVGLAVTPPNGFRLVFKPLTSLAAGVYSGTINVQVFRDAAMTQPYRVSGGTLPYALTVDPELTIAVKIDGVLQAETFSSSHYAVSNFNPLGYGTIYWYGADEPSATWTLHAGQVVELESSVPVTWYGPDRTAGPYGFWFSPPVVTETRIVQTMPDPTVHQTMGLRGSAFIAMPVDGRGQFGAGFTFDLAP